MTRRIEAVVRALQTGDRDMDERTARALATKMDEMDRLEDYCSTHLVDPPSQAALAMHQLQEPGKIERVEEGDDTVRYKDIMLIAPGVWKDAASGEPVYYSPRGMKNAVQNVTGRVFNFLHERQDEMWAVGHFENEYADDQGRIFADVVLDTGKTAGQLADEALEAALETGGQKGVEGPSIEIMGNEYEFNLEKGVREIVNGEINGAGLVGVGITPGPASKTASFDHQTRERAVALAQDEGSARILTLTSAERDSSASTVAEGEGNEGPPPKVFEMAQGLLQSSELDRDQVADQVADLWPSLSREDVLDVLDEADEQKQAQEDDEDDPDEEEGDDGDEDPEEDEDPDEEEGDEPEGDLASQVQQAIKGLRTDLDQRFSAMEEELEQLKREKEELAEADDVNELASRIENLEDQPKDPQSLADGANGGADEQEEGLDLLQGFDPNQPEVSVSEV